jgi:hypothetical protein
MSGWRLINYPPIIVIGTLLEIGWHVQAKHWWTGRPGA